MKKGNPDDPKGLIFEAYRMAELTAGECRSIFLDWALSLPDDVDQRGALKRLLGYYGNLHPDHPMSEVIKDGTMRMEHPRRRGGWRSRPRN